jgi:hypothetical protein
VGLFVVIERFWANRRRFIFIYDILVLLVLLALAVLYVRFRSHEFVQAWITDRYRVFAHCMWLGAIGGVVISLKGVYDHARDPPWDHGYNLWHFGRPFNGAITGLITVLIFVFFAQNGQFNHPVVYLAAFILGTQEMRFFAFLAEIGRIIVQVPPSVKAPSGLRVAAIDPSEGRAGTQLIVAGQGFEQGAKVKLGGIELEKPLVSADGRAVSGVVPKLEGATRMVDVTVHNPGGSSLVVPDKFKYVGT